MLTGFQMLLLLLPSPLPSCHCCFLLFVLKKVFKGFFFTHLLDLDAACRTHNPHVVCKTTITTKTKRALLRCGGVLQRVIDRRAGLKGGCITRRREANVLV